MARKNRALPKDLIALEQSLEQIRKFDFLQEEPWGTFRFAGADVLHFHVRGKRPIAHLRVNGEAGTIFDLYVDRDWGELLAALKNRAFFQGTEPSPSDVQEPNLGTPTTGSPSV